MGHETVAVVEAPTIAKPALLTDNGSGYIAAAMEDFLRLLGFATCGAERITRRPPARSSGCTAR